MATVFIETITPHLLLMHWTRHPQPNDVNQAFNAIITHLNQSDTSVNIIVDIRADPQFHTHLTVQRAFATNQHSLMGNWLVVGSNSTAKLISRLITTLNRDNIHWFDTPEAARASVDRHTTV